MKGLPANQTCQTCVIGVVILAAGKSQRMGRPKLLLPWAQTSVIGHLIAQWQAVPATQIAVVCAAGDQALQTELNRLGFSAANRICNPDPDRGMFSSIQCAARWDGWLPTLTDWAITPGDQPLVRTETLRRLLAFSAMRPGVIRQPAQGGHRRHPVVLPRAAFLELADTPAPTLRDFLQTKPHALALCPIDDPGLELDMDYPADYAAAREQARNQ
jgi:molybdenum cofactor cytidylyltransferase